MIMAASLVWSAGSTYNSLSEAERRGLRAALGVASDSSVHVEQLMKLSLSNLYLWSRSI